MRDRPKSVVSLIGGFKEGSGSNMSMVCGSVQFGPVRYRTPSSKYRRYLMFARLVTSQHLIQAEEAQAASRGDQNTLVRYCTNSCAHAHVSNKAALLFGAA